MYDYVRMREKTEKECLQLFSLQIETKESFAKNASFNI